MSNDSIKKTIVVALGVCLVCSILVATAAVALKTRQEQNKKLEKIKNILQAADLYEKGLGVKEVFERFKQKVQPVIVELKTGVTLTEDRYNELLNPEDYDIKAVAKNSRYGERIPGKEDLAGIKRKPKFVLIYFVKENDTISKIVLPVYGKGLWSTLYGFIALKRDLDTVSGFTIYEHGETPGLGGEVDNPAWKASWKGKTAFNKNNELILTVIKGKVDPSRPEAKFQIDGLSGSTLTTNGLRDMIKFWLGPDGYSGFFKKFREERTNG